MFTFYTYEVYGFVLKSNIFMPLLPEIGADCAFDVELKVTYDLIEDDSPIKITENSEYFVVDLCPFAVYKVYKKECLIECSARNFTDFFSTFFNIPFSVFDTENAVLGQIVCGVQIGCNCGCGTS